MTALTEEERQAILDKVGDQLLLCLEQAAENITAVVFGEKRLALVPRKHDKIKTGPIHEFRLVKAPGRDVWSEPAPAPVVPPALSEDEIAALVEELEKPITEADLVGPVKRIIVE